MATAPELVDSLEEVRPLARALAVELVRQELVGLRIGLNGSAPGTAAAGLGTFLVERTFLHGSR